jgi:YggT family protein
MAEASIEGPVARRALAASSAKPQPMRDVSSFGQHFKKRSPGGAEGDRTPDLVIANDALSQLSYGPVAANGRHLGFGPAGCQGGCWRPAGGSCPTNTQWLHVAKFFSEKSMLAVIQTIVLALDIYWWIIIIAAVFSWLFAFNVVNSNNQLVNTVADFLYKATEPALRPIRRFMPDLGGLDISPIILLLIIFFIRQFLIQTVAPAVI